jgi:hypothetical protein
VLKITQHNPAKVWKYVPVQHFTSASDIDWSKSIPEIDVDLYAKYGLDEAEIAFIESQVKPMDVPRYVAAASSASQIRRMPARGGSACGHSMADPRSVPWARR